MVDFLAKLFDTSDFPARWNCGTWTGSHGWLHILSDVAIFGAYAAIPAVLIFFVLRRKDIPLLPVFWLFAGFILFCGVGHLIEATLYWHPWYRLSGLVKLMTALISWATVMALVRVTPQALALPGLARLSAELKAENQQRAQAQQVLQLSRDELETRVLSRTEELTRANAFLQQEIARRQQAVEISTRQADEVKVQRLAALSLAQDAEEARKRVEEVEERLSLALKSSEVGTWSWNVAENSIIWDDFIHPLFGLEPGTFPGRYEDFLKTLHPEDRDRVEHEVARAVEGDEAYDTEYQVVWPNGSVHVLGSRGKVFRDAAGNAVRMTGVCWDITDRKRALETVARQAQELARSNMELEQFAYIASHDLQEPLRKVQSFGDLLAAKAGKTLGEEERDYLKRMQVAAARMQGLINDLLAFARVTSQAKAFVTVDLNRVVREVLSDLETRIKTTGGRVEIGTLPLLDSDPLQMRQLLQNLIGNALKFHRPDVPPEIAVAGRVVKGGDGGTLEHGRSDRVCEITVQDNGIGFDEKYLDRIFLPFQRLHGRGEFEGTGMGLAICRKIVERHGGTLTARSTLGEGTTFIVLLPLHQPKGDR